MKKWFPILAMILAVFGVGARAQDSAPLKLVHTLKLSPTSKEISKDRMGFLDASNRVINFPVCESRTRTAL